jgi:hypothetical protein
MLESASSKGNGDSRSTSPSGENSWIEGLQMLPADFEALSNKRSPMAIVKNDVLLAMNRQSEKLSMTVLTTRCELSLQGRKSVAISNPETNQIALSFHSSQ